MESQKASHGGFMLISNHDFSAAGSSSRDAVEGLGAIAAALDQGLEATGSIGNKIVDAVAIALGWFLLVAVIFYPALQIAAIALCASFMCMRSFVRYVLDSGL